MTDTLTFNKPDLEDTRLFKPQVYRMLIDGKSVDAKSGKVIERESPGHVGRLVGTWPEASEADVKSAIGAARRAFDEGPWPRTTGAERSAIMHRVADLILENVDSIALAKCLEVGKAIAQATGEIGYCADL